MYRRAAIRRRYRQTTRLQAAQRRSSRPARPYPPAFQLVQRLVNRRDDQICDRLDRVAQGFARTVAEHGPDSVAFYISGQLLTEDYYVVNKLAKGFIGTANTGAITTGVTTGTYQGATFHVGAGYTVLTGSLSGSTFALASGASGILADYSLPGIATGTGAEVQRPLATVVIGGEP